MSARQEAPAIFLLVALALWAISGDVAAEQSPHSNLIAVDNQSEQAAHRFVVSVEPSADRREVFLSTIAEQSFKHRISDSRLYGHERCE